MAKGRHAWSWDGRDRKGQFVKSGDYQAVITVRTSAGTVVLTTRRSTSGRSGSPTSDATPKRGQKIRIRVYTTEPLKSAPRIRVSQPGHHDRVLGTKRVGSAYMATITLRSSGKAGSLRIAAIGTDKGGARQSFTEVLHLH